MVACQVVGAAERNSACTAHGGFHCKRCDTYWNVVNGRTYMHICALSRLPFFASPLGTEREGPHTGGSITYRYTYV